MPMLSEWDPFDAGVWAELYGRQTISLRHPSYPAEIERPSREDQWSEGLNEYLSRVAQRLGLEAIQSRENLERLLPWLPLRPAGSDSDTSSGSHQLFRYDDAEAVLDQSIVFVATLAGDGQPLGSRVGLRIVGHVDGDSLRISSVARSISLPEALERAQAFSALFHSPQFQGALVPFLNALLASLRAALMLPEAMALHLEGLNPLGRENNRLVLETYVNVPRPEPGQDSSAHAYAVTARVSVPIDDEQRGGKDPGEELRVISLERYPLVAHARHPVVVPLFPGDPSSNAGRRGLIASRTNRGPEILNGFRRDITLTELPFGGRGPVELRDQDNLVEVRRSRLVDQSANDELTQIGIPDELHSARCNAHAAFSAYQHLRALFDERLPLPGQDGDVSGQYLHRHARPLFGTLRAYGLAPRDYFRFAAAPLLVRYRAGMCKGPGKDGKIVNAEVDYDPCNCGPFRLGDSRLKDSLRPLQLRFALADVKRTASRREPLGLSSDPRWSWHEYSHVLLAAQTGALELAFVHSVGDALAAIVNDPWSKLVGDAWSRGYTFPWAYLARRHDRRVEDGWGWCSRRHRPGRFDRIGGLHRRKGYDTEQILSSSLFRLYRSLGGDTCRPRSGEPARHRRQAAADYTAYLILRAIRLMPAIGGNLLETPDQLVSALIDSDIATCPAAAGPLRHRVGGWAHKVVRWAFEAQGLYATHDQAEVVDLPGRPPPIDLCIADRRVDLPGNGLGSGYEPVSLDWRSAAWHASDEAIEVKGCDVIVRVNNRGYETAKDVETRLWCLNWHHAAHSPWWHPRHLNSAWTLVGRQTQARIPPWTAAASPAAFRFQLPDIPGARRLLLLAETSCGGDRSNIDVASKLPCSRFSVPLVDLVAGDNNLGLRILRRHG